MPEIISVTNVQDAVELAQRFKAEGRYNWFRGQVRDWSPVSSLFRILRSGDLAALENAKTRISLFYEWIDDNPPLRYLRDEQHIHQFFAIAQHYGIPTNYIDFTIDPAIAGFFAADTKVSPAEGMSCIYCLDTEDLLELVSDFKAVGARKDVSIEAVEVDVTNLWRLQAQRGVFLFSDYNWDIDYPLDRIVFPYSGYPSYPPRDYIYPREKSALELLLDQYVDIESKYFGNLQMRKMVADLKAIGRNAEIQTMNSFDGGFYAGAFVDPSRLMPLASWSRSRDPAWQAYPDEHFDSVGGGHTERIHLNAADRQSLERAVVFGVKQVLDAKPQHRAKLVEWRLDGVLGDLPTDRLSTAFRIAWNGMRFLPFSNAQIAAAFSATAGLIAADFGGLRQPADNRVRFSEVRGEGFQVEFACKDSSSSRGYANKEALRTAMRRDLKTLVRPEHYDRIDDVRATFLLIQNPILLFDFESLVEIFARDLIPSQIVAGRKPILFNPAALTIFGLP